MSFEIVIEGAEHFLSEKLNGKLQATAIKKKANYM